MGKKVVTLADKGYPKKLKAKLKGGCPPLFNFVGDLARLSEKRWDLLVQERLAMRTRLFLMKNGLCQCRAERDNSATIRNDTIFVQPAVCKRVLIV